MNRIGRRISAEPETHPIEKVLGFTEEMVDAKQKPIPNFSEAIRRLVELGLSQRGPEQNTRELTRD
jgi:hypothetical protein